MVIIVCGPLNYILVCMYVWFFIYFVDYFIGNDYDGVKREREKKRNTRSEVIKTISMLKVKSKINA